MAKSTASNLAFSFDAATVSFDAEAFDDVLRNHGVRFVHWRAMRCPVGMVDRYDSRRVHEDHSGCSNGHIYTRAGVVTGIFTGNDNKVSQNDIGLLDGSSVQVTLPRTYDDTEEEVMVAPFDRFYLLEETITVPHQQYVEAHVTGKDKLSFPATKVLDLIDWRGQRWGVGDFSVDSLGQLVWSTGHGPGYDVDKKKGNIYAVRYTYRPYWYCSRLIHQVRVAQVEVGIERVTSRMPQSFVLAREYVFEKEDNDELAPNPDSPRQVKGPRQGTFGPR